MEVYYHINLRGKSSVKVDSLDADHRNILIVWQGIAKLLVWRKSGGTLLTWGSYKEDRAHLFAQVKPTAPTTPTVPDTLSTRKLSTVLKGKVYHIGQGEVHVKRDKTSKELLDWIHEGCIGPVQNTQNSLHLYWLMMECFRVLDTIQMWQDRAVILGQLRQEVLNALHSAQQGVSTMTMRAGIYQGIQGTLR